MLAIHSAFAPLPNDRAEELFPIRDKHVRPGPLTLAPDVQRRQQPLAHRP